MLFLDHILRFKLFFKNEKRKEDHKCLCYLISMLIKIEIIDIVKYWSVMPTTLLKLKHRTALHPPKSNLICIIALLMMCVNPHSKTKAKLTSLTRSHRAQSYFKSVEMSGMLVCFSQRICFYSRHFLSFSNQFHFFYHYLIFVQVDTQLQHIYSNIIDGVYK